VNQCRPYSVRAKALAKAFTGGGNPPLAEALGAVSHDLDFLYTIVRENAEVMSTCKPLSSVQDEEGAQAAALMRHNLERMIRESALGVDDLSDTSSQDGKDKAANIYDKKALQRMIRDHDDSSSSDDSNEERRLRQKDTSRDEKLFYSIANDILL
jgi:hypothetical protein